MSFLSKTKKDIETQLEEMIRGKADELLIEAIERTNNAELLKEVEPLRPKDPEPTAEDLRRAEELNFESATLQQAVLDKLQSDIFPTIDKIIAINNHRAGLLLTSNGFMIANYLNEIKSALNKYQNEICLGHREIPVYKDSRKK